jgi:anti-sigma regulatory factor (Ser/Thr protein kinase)
MTPDITELKVPDRTLDISSSRRQKLLPFFEMSIASDPTLVDDAVEDFAKAIGGTTCWGEVEGMCLAVREALANAIFHGNNWDPQKTVEISVGVSQNHDLVIIVKDSGPGFDPSAIPNPAAQENLLANHGRGISLILQCMDQVDFTFDHGTEVYMRRRRKWLV